MFEVRTLFASPFLMEDWDQYRHYDSMKLKSIYEDSLNC